MNLGNLERLALWLEDGAPYIVFDMYTGVGNLELLDPETKHECGTACCIAGMAHQLAQPRPILWDEDQRELNWRGEVRPTALEWLGLPNNEQFFGHDLFDADLAPYNCSPAQAAIAVRNVMEGRCPW